MSSVLADRPANVAPIELPPSALALAAVGRGGGFAEGERASVRLAGETLRIDLDGAPALEIATAGLGPVANVVHTPGLVRSERIGPSGAVTEAILVAPTIPIAWIQWSPGPAASVPPVRLQPMGLWESTGGSTDGGVLLRAQDGAARTGGNQLAVWVTGPAVLTARHDGREGFTVDPVPDESGAVTLVVAHGDARALRGARAAAPHALAHARRAASEPDGGLTLRTGVVEIDEGVAWARARLPGLARSGRLLPALAALSGGDETSARDACAALPPGSAERVILSARIAAATGDPDLAVACAAVLDATPDTLDADLGAAAATMLADGLRYAAPEARIESLRRRGTELRVGRSAGGGPGRSLPMAGKSAAPKRSGMGAWIASLMNGVPGAGSPPPGALAQPVAALRSATATFLTDPDGAWSEWRAALAEGLERGPLGPGSWDDPESPDPESVTAELILALAHGLLGIGQDAPVGRLQLAPRLPGHIDRFAVDGIAVGDARLQLSYRRDGAAHHYEIRPTVAAVPPLVVFEPSVPGSVQSTRVDGEAAELEVRRHGARSIVPVQLPVDGVRTLEVVTREG